MSKLYIYRTFDGNALRKLGLALVQGQGQIIQGERESRKNNIIFFTINLVSWCGK